MPTQVKGRELDVADRELFARGVQCRLQHGDAVVLQHVQQCCFTCIIEAEEEKFGVFVGQTEVGEDLPDCNGGLVRRHMVVCGL